MDGIVKLLFSIGATLVAYIPLWLYLVARYMFDPNGFWQNLILFGFALYFLGVIQLILLAIWIIVLVAIWKD